MTSTTATTATTAFRPISSADPVLIYNYTKQLFFASPGWRQKQSCKTRDADTSLITAFPRLTAKPSEAGVMVVGYIKRTGDTLHLHEPLYIRSGAESSLLGTEVYLGVDSTDPATTTGLREGQRILFQNLDNVNAVSWRVSVPPDRTWHTLVNPTTASDELLYYGVPYLLSNAAQGTYLQADSEGLGIAGDGHLRANLDLPSATIDQWVFLPTYPIFVCQRAVEQCVSTRGSQNAFNPFICDADGKACYNLAKERVFHTEADCNRVCGIVADLPLRTPTSTSTSAATTSTQTVPVTTKFPRPSGRMSADMLLWGTLLSLMWIMGLVLLVKWFQLRRVSRVVTLS